MSEPTPPGSPPDCVRCGASWPEHAANNGQCPRPPLVPDDLHTERNLPGQQSLTDRAADRWERRRRTGNQPPSGHRGGLVGGLVFVGAAAGLVWLLTANGAASCSTLAQLSGSTCYPALVTLHTGTGVVALVGFIGAVLAAVMGRK